MNYNDINTFKWQYEKPEGDFGVVTGCDSNHQWMLQWWWRNYRKHNEYPVHFADFGMDNISREWAKNRGNLIPLRFKINKNWFKKPLSILHCPFKYIIWVDLDCEIRGNLKPLFANAAEHGFAATVDPHNRFIKTEKKFASGVIACRNGNPIVLEWAKKCMDPGPERGDQEVLNNKILISKYDQITTMRPEHQWLRLDGDNKDAIIMHWTGSKGKSIIRRQISGTPGLSISNSRVKSPRSRVKSIHKQSSDKINKSYNGEIKSLKSLNGPLNTNRRKIIPLNRNLK